MKTSNRLVIASILSGTALMGAAGGSLLNTATASAATTAATAPADQQNAPDPSKGGHVANGITETVLTGDDATKATAAAQAAVSGGTVQRVETDAEGATYEAHVKKSDGSQVTVKLDANFKVTSVEDGMK